MEFLKNKFIITSSIAFLAALVILVFELLSRGLPTYYGPYEAYGRILILTGIGIVILIIGLIKK